MATAWMASLRASEVVIIAKSSTSTDWSLMNTFMGKNDLKK
jgi:hypothetical protein